MTRIFLHAEGIPEEKERNVSRERKIETTHERVFTRGREKTKRNEGRYSEPWQSPVDSR